MTSEATFAKHLGDPVAYAIADAIGEADIETVVGSFMPCGERWDLATLIADHLRDQGMLSDAREGNGR